MSRRAAQLRRLLALRLYALPAILLLAVTLPHPDQGDFRTDAGWYSAIGLQAWRTGHFWTLYGEPGQPYFNKPPLVFWIHGLFLHVLGVHVWAARLPSILAALGCVLATVAITRTFMGRRAAVLAGGVLALTIEFFRRTREVSLDMWQTLFLLLALLLVVRAVKRERWALIAAAGVPIGLALMCKPLTALVFIPIAAIWLAWIGRPRQTVWLLATAGIAAAIAAPWHLSMIAQHGREFLRQYFGVEIGDRLSGRLQAGHDEPIPAWFYLHQLATRGWPWVLFVAFALIRWGRGLLDADRRGLRLAAVWTVCWLVLLSAFADRRDRYALPLHPGMAMLAAAWLAHPAGRAGALGVRWSLRWIGPIFAAFGVALSVAPVALQDRPDPQWPALFDWVRASHLNARGGDELWQGAFNGPHGARLYLEFGWWPRTTRNRWGELLATPPAGAMLVYHTRDGWAPGPNEETLFTSGDLRVTRLGDGGWHPVSAPP